MTIRRFNPTKESPEEYTQKLIGASEARAILDFEKYLARSENAEATNSNPQQEIRSTPNDRFFYKKAGRELPHLDSHPLRLTPQQAETQKQIDDLLKEILKLKFIVRKLALEEFMATDPHEMNEKFERETHPALITEHLLSEKYYALKMIFHLDRQLHISPEPTDQIYSLVKPYLEKIFTLYEALVSQIEKALSLQDQLLSATPQNHQPDEEIKRAMEEAKTSITQLQEQISDAKKNMPANWWWKTIEDDHDELTRWTNRNLKYQFEQDIRSLHFTVNRFSSAIAVTKTRAR